ncbi:MAG: sensor histidine kinase [Bryobacteraceae bacterium]
MYRRSASEMRVLILAPFGRDAALIANCLRPLEIETIVAPDAQSLVQMLTEGAGCAIVAEEALTPSAIDCLKAWLAQQPPWSDTPFVVLTFTGRATRHSHRKAEELQSLGNVTLIERPVRPDTAQSSVRSALRARMRQYEIRARQEELIQAIADLEQFAHSASHDLREPLRSISIYSELVTRNYAHALDERGKDFLALIGSSARRMDALLDDLLSYAHASSISDDAPEPVCPMTALNMALENLAGAIQESGAKISVGELPSVRMRESHLAQLFQNLIGNAIKYRDGRREAEIQLSSARSDGKCIFTVADNGIGVPADYRESIFGIFKRLHSDAEYSGTGMGLAICKRIVERYGGRIWVESEPDGGAKFCFSVPG